MSSTTSFRSRKMFTISELSTCKLLFDQRAELVKAQKVSLDDLIDEVKTIEAETTDDLDF
jgi:hypothetical protein